MDRLTKAVLSLFGLGLLPVAPGTWGTAGAFLIALVLPAGASWPIAAGAVFLAACALTVVLGNRAERIAGGEDPGFVVMDEVAGYFVTIAALDKPEIGWLVAGFFVFRVFDIVKPWPARALEKLHGGFGILLDDVFAGLYGLVVLSVAKLVIG